MNGRWRAALDRELLRRRLPHGLSGPAAWLARGPAARIHRALWWSALPALPRPAYIALDLLAWLRWIGWSAWRASARVARRVETSPGPGRHAAFGRLLRLALAWGVPPLQALRLGLHEGTGSVADFVFDHEADAWHRHCNAGLADAAVGALLRDKHGFAIAAACAGLPVVDTWRALAAGEQVGFEAAVGARDACFCKRRVGNGGAGAFAAWRQAGGWRGRHADGRRLDDAAAVEAAWRSLLRDGPVLLQPLLRDAPDVAAWHDAAGGCVGEVATVRVVTRRGADGAARCVAAWLELRVAPAGAWLACPVDVATGAWRLPDEPAPGAVALAAMHALRGACAGTGRIAGWARVDGASRDAHAMIGGLWAVAWDWVCTDRGPCLLEGNAGFSLLALQRATGGLLAAAGQAGEPSRSR
jgi:hypothetical protein